MTLLRRSALLTTFVIAVLPLAALRPMPQQPDSGQTNQQADARADKQAAQADQQAAQTDKQAVQTDKQAAQTDSGS